MQPKDIASYSQALSKSSAKKQLGSLTPKDLFKNVEALYKRLLKHFSGDQHIDKQLVGVLWKALREDQGERFKKGEEMVVKVYGVGMKEMGVGIQLQDIEAAFEGHVV